MYVRCHQYKKVSSLLVLRHPKCHLHTCQYSTCSLVWWFSPLQLLLFTLSLPTMGTTLTHLLFPFLIYLYLVSGHLIRLSHHVLRSRICRRCCRRHHLMDTSQDTRLEKCSLLRHHLRSHPPHPTSAHHQSIQTDRVYIYIYMINQMLEIRACSCQVILYMHLENHVPNELAYPSFCNVN
jgi:hypothetical protein